ncbi:MAG: hypothetical protein U1E16_02560 [Hyphomicrobiales bacterium]|uniref:hypothetical protein n=1 Tax=Aestuariivirga sp. TaxID=2650926 RepID=UPI0035AFD1AD
MARQATRTQIVLAQIAAALLVVFALVGLLLHGASGPVWDRIFTSIAERPGGPMTFRFILQPVMATILAAIDGFRDARSGAPPYFWSLVTGSTARGDRLFDGIIATSRVILLGLVMDVAYQLIEFGTLYPGEAAIVAVLLAFLPYLLLRGPFERLARLWGAGQPQEDKRT